MFGSKKKALDAKKMEKIDAIEKSRKIRNDAWKKFSVMSRIPPGLTNLKG